ncbi:hypothetical protein CAPTEDRAFT_222340 [Capitella teleta]|uniref:Sarcoplasmic reticulum histidine-rich calcium-binding protein n=1 Tax=Capitella teleta TaxID=283909 RepID=R7U0G6_CAPTE|nr:hypothetical protein CAPTEDRAFT_222340 [Capitella teleta]|eukprot:ELT99494.1 hypothetical protein CAPTEDRAFT_222340 [Capitella teleta]
MKAFCEIGAFLLFSLSLLVCVNAETDEDQVEAQEMNEEMLEYAKGSLCNYCDYCKFCKLCDSDCPCESSPSQPNCHMCKYCKFCHLCKACDAVCSPGGFIDTVTAKLFGALPSFNKESVDSDIEGVKDWIEKKRDEL